VWLLTDPVPRQPEAHRAQALVEFALILPVLLLMTLGMIDLGRAFAFGVGTQQGAREAARYASRYAISRVTVTDDLVRQRLIDASFPSLQGCDATNTDWQDCGGGSWKFTLAVTPPGVGAPTYNSIQSAVTYYKNLSGGQITVTANGAVAMLGGYCLGQTLCLPPIGVQGQASMEFI
jgi:Flp pilus assembly protein TadG